MRSVLSKIFVVAMIGLLLVGSPALLTPATVEAKPGGGGPPGPPGDCMECPGMIKNPPCVCYLYDCTPTECVYECQCW